MEFSGKNAVCFKFLTFSFFRLCESIVSTLGYGWVLALCAPGVHPGTLFLALKILVSLTKYPQLLEKFRDGTSNGGWLTDADSVIRNRAAVSILDSFDNEQKFEFKLSEIVSNF